MKRGAWTLHYTLGTIISGPVAEGDVVALPVNRGMVTIQGGTPPQRVKDRGTVLTTLGYLQPRELGMVWVHDGGGLSELLT